LGKKKVFSNLEKQEEINRGTRTETAIWEPSGQDAAETRRNLKKILRKPKACTSEGPARLQKKPREYWVPRK